MCCDDNPATNPMSGIMFNPPTESFPFATFPMTGDKLLALLAEIEGQGFTYHLAAKIDPIDLQGPELIGTDEQTGAKGKFVDCSGFTRWALWHASGILVPDGSVNQHDWARANQLKRTTPEACELKDDVVRWCFLTPEQGGGVGHTLLVLNGKTLESHGGKGPDSRPFDPASHPWMGELDCFVATKPEGA